MTDELAEEARALGVPEAAIAALHPGVQAAEAWPANSDALDAFLSVSTQWRAVALQSGKVHFLGLDYAAADTDLRNSGITVTPGLWADLKTMEAGARAALNGTAAAAMGAEQ